MYVLELASATFLTKNAARIFILDGVDHQLSFMSRMGPSRKNPFPEPVLNKMNEDQRWIILCNWAKWVVGEAWRATYMMTSSNGNIFRYTGHLCGEFTGSPHKGQWHGALMFSLICVSINDWVNNRETGDLRRYRAHYDVTVTAGVHTYRGWDYIQYIPNTARCRYKAVNPITRPWGRYIGCLLWFQNVFHFLPLLSQCRMQ